MDKVMKNTMLASYLIRLGLIELREISIPKSSHDEIIIIKTKAVLTCVTDLKAYPTF